MTAWNPAIVVAVLALMGSVLAPAFAYYVTKRHQLEAASRESKVAHYRELLSAISDIAVDKDDLAARRRFALSINTVALVGPQSVVVVISLGVLAMALITVAYVQGTSPMPAHAHRNVYNTGWECDRGFERKGEVCGAFVVPAHAQINVYNTGWECQRGYERQGEVCGAFVLPAHAQINVYNTGWECQRGYERQGEVCVAFVLPAHAQINVYNTGWECQHGYERRSNECVAFILPAHAQINAYNTGWECVDDYKKNGDTCVPMSPAEIAAARRGRLASAAQVALQRAAADSVDWSSCSDSLDRLRRAARNATDEADNVSSAKSDWEQCKSEQRDCNSERSDYESRLSSAQSALDTVQSRHRTAMSECGGC